MKLCLLPLVFERCTRVMHRERCHHAAGAMAIFRMIEMAGAKPLHSVPRFLIPDS